MTDRIIIDGEHEYEQEMTKQKPQLNPSLWLSKSEIDKMLADERAKMFSELDELQEFLEADMWQAIHTNELSTEKKLQDYLRRHFEVVRKGMGVT